MNAMTMTAKPYHLEALSDYALPEGYVTKAVEYFAGLCEIEEGSPLYAAIQEDVTGDVDLLAALLHGPGADLIEFLAHDDLSLYSITETTGSTAWVNVTLENLRRGLGDLEAWKALMSLA